MNTETLNSWAKTVPGLFVGGSCNSKNASIGAAAACFVSKRDQ